LLRGDNVNKEEILSMEPGRELDITVAKKVMCHGFAEDEIIGDTEASYDSDGAPIWGPLMPYSTDMKVADLIIDKMVKEGFAGAVNWGSFGDGEYTEPEAICKAALLAVLCEEYY